MVSLQESIKRLSAISQYSSSFSTQMKSTPDSLHKTAVEPDPLKGSRIMPPLGGAMISDCPLLQCLGGQ